MIGITWEQAERERSNVRENAHLVFLSRLEGLLDHARSQMETRRETFAELWGHVQGRVVKAVTRRVGERYHHNCPLEDCLNEALLALWSALEERQWHLGAPAVVRLLVNTAYERWRSSLRRQLRRKTIAWGDCPELEFLSGKPTSPCFHRQDAGATDVLRESLAYLSPELRHVLVLRYFTDDGSTWSVKQVARRLGIPPGTVKSRLHRAYQLVKQFLEGKGCRPMPCSHAA